MLDNIYIPWDGWKIVRRIGKGSYGTVYEIERALGTYTEKAAMKVISIPLDHSAIEAAYVEGYDDESISILYSNQLEQILDEYRNMEELSGYSNIVTCKDVSVIPHDNAFGWDIYIRMELLTPLMTYLKNNNDIDSEDICRLGIDICNALELCEKREIVHRDVKPENIFVTKDGTFKLGDFGIARTLDHTTQATRAGTERYMAPEVIKREPYGKDVDLYSLGLVLYWLLNNRRMPFLNPNKVPVGDEPNVAQSKRLSGEALPRPFNGSEELQNIILKACEYNREKRYSSAKEMLQDLTFLTTKSISIINTDSSTGSDENTIGLDNQKRIRHNESTVNEHKLDHSYTGLFELSNGSLYYVSNGIVDASYSGLVSKGEDKYLVINGKVDFDAIGIYQDESGIWYVKYGKVDYSASGIAVWPNGINKGKTYYVNNGQIIDAKYQTDDGKTVIVKNGMIINSGEKDSSSIKNPFLLDSDLDQKVSMTNKTGANAWDVGDETVGKDFFENKESELDYSEQKTITPEWEEEKKSKQQKTQNIEMKDDNKTPLRTEIVNGSSKNEPVPLSETIPNTTNSEGYSLLSLFFNRGEYY